MKVHGGSFYCFLYFCENVSNFRCQNKFVFLKHIVSVKETLLRFQIPNRQMLESSEGEGGRGPRLPCSPESWTQGLRSGPSKPALPAGVNQRTFSMDSPGVEPQFLERPFEF